MEAYYGMKPLMEPEGWPTAQSTARDKLSGECNQPLRDSTRKERLDACKALADKQIPITEELINEQMEKTQRQMERL